MRKIASNALSVEDWSIYASSPVVSDFVCDSVVDSHDQLAPSIADSLSGECLVIGYGHSGSGKTFSIFGPGGVLECVPLNEDFLDVSFLEVYNERVYDLLAIEGDNKPLAVLEDMDRQLVVRDLTTIRVETAEELDAVVSVGVSHRAVAENAVHLESSRSHAILQLRKPDGRSVWLCDLAGSERARKTAKKTGNREINSIHRSLHALRRCIMALRRNEHIPARSSVLTRLLFSSHQIDQCVLIACVSPDKDAVGETLSTLDFAACGLAVQAWGSTGKGACESETELLRSALQQVTLELEREKARRIALEHEITRHSTPSFWAPKTANPTPENESDDADLPPLFQDHSLKWSPISSPRDLSRADVEDSVLSQTWRHNQYDAILKRCWAST